MSAPRGLTAEESAVWAKLAATVTPIAGKAVPKVEATQSPAEAPPPLKQGKGLGSRQRLQAPSTPSRLPPQGGLDGQWDRKLKAGSIRPELTLDLHGHSLDAAYDRLMDGMAQARAMGVRVVLLITGKPRPVDPADRAERRGAIRAKILDWLAASSHHAAIAAIRPAHIRHGGAGALYVVLRR